MGLFDELPAPRAAEKPHAEPSTAVEEGDQRPEKRQRTGVDDEDQHAGPSGSGADAAAEAAAAEQRQHEPDAAADAEPPPPPPMPSDQVGPALLRIANHLPNAAKFPKASGLLRQLIAGGALGAAHRAPLFAYAHPEHAADPALRRDYRRLLNAFANGVPPDVLTPEQGAHFEIYSIWTLQRGELDTDDSFAFNKAVSRLKEDIAALGPATPEDEAAAARLELPGGARRAAPVAAGRAAAGAAAAAAAAAAEAEADPFGLDELIQQDGSGGGGGGSGGGGGGGSGRGGGHEAPDPDAPWTAAELSVMRRQALLDCVAAAKAMHRLAWARTGVEMLIDAAHAAAANFVAPQRAVLDDYARWVRAERAARRSGAAPGGKELTAFEKARAEWAGASVSRYGKVGGAGDSKSTHWLG
ncbi:hypothetical protein Rsub_01066 [Raphidocelis subcapitata]|uniref:Uncharacterized protein n=1 Tax=Raphidocelis subcapitata TaxID=307507 RepID=A0A2V0NLP2_9CHLO|nr:hypothetical protein Rsub_01066 [Raphidocelis subcapitata]|eukprot:GBF88354.1 hypothetical protein Rsub_01066 [Raphidocelis subcapitata]